ncbi:radical SAM protein, partial [archaeon]|nr:radical SAM protein [archaeon]
KGIKYALLTGIIVRSDIVLTKLNYKKFPEIIRFLYTIGIREIDVLHIVPFGSAWKNWKILNYDLNDAVPFLHEGLKFAKEKDMVIWTNRFPPKYLFGFESLIQDTAKLIDEMYGRKFYFEHSIKINKKPNCYGKRCQFCYLNDTCSELFILAENKKIDFFSNENNQFRIINLKKGDLNIYEQIIEDNKNNILFNLPPPGDSMIEYQKKYFKLSDYISHLKEKADAQNKKILFRNVPACISGKENIIKNPPKIKNEFLNSDGSIDVIKFVEDYAKRRKIKGLACDDCLLNDDCEGIYQKYVQVQGFDELKPFINTKLIRINLDCNQNCLFCNTNEHSENLILDEKEILKEIEKSNCNRIIFSGRETTLDTNLCKYIKFASNKKIKDIKIQTNAIRCSNINYCKKLLDSGLTGAFVSLHAHNSVISEKITQAPGTFIKKIEGIKNLTSLNIRVEVNLVINSINYQYLNEIVKYIIELGLKEINFSFVAPVHNAKNNLFIVPKISDIVPFLKSAIKLCKKANIEFNIPDRCGIPICFMPEYLNYFDASLKNNIKKTRDHIMGENCINCDLYDKCDGLWKVYADKYGFDELKIINKSENEGMKQGIVGISTNCNQSCIFCLDKNIKGLEEPSFEEVKKSIDDLKIKNANSIVYMSCESLLRKDFYDIFSYVESKQIEQKLITNGTLLSNKTVFDKLIKVGLRKLAISIHSYDEKSSEEITGNRNSFSMQMRGLQNISQYNLENPLDKFEIELRLVVNKYNIMNLNEIVKNYISKLNAKFDLLIKLVRPIKNTDKEKYMPLSSEIKKYFPSFLNYLNENKSKFEDILFDNFPYCIIKDFEINSRELRDIIRRTSYLDDNPHTKRQTKILDIF